LIIWTTICSIFCKKPATYHPPKADRLAFEAWLSESDGKRVLGIRILPEIEINPDSAPPQVCFSIGRRWDISTESVFIDKGARVAGFKSCQMPRKSSNKIPQNHLKCAHLISQTFN
jgi:hypothetical protein